MPALADRYAGRAAPSLNREGVFTALPTRLILHANPDRRIAPMSSHIPMRTSTRTLYPARIVPIVTTGIAMGEIRESSGMPTPVVSPKSTAGAHLPAGRCRRATMRLLGGLAFLLAAAAVGTDASEEGSTPVYAVQPIGWIRKADGRTIIEVEPRYQPALLGVAELEAIWVLYWFDRNDTPQGRSILQVHPRANPDNPLRGVFATRAPVRPNPIALSRCRVLSVRDNVIEIDDIDAFPDTPVLDIKP
jgi:tRNA (adenine37-N6)-methyltransferase